MKEYSLSLDDIVSYLETKGQDEVVGTMSSFKCLGAQTLRYKYKESFYIPYVNSHYIANGVESPIDHDVIAVLDRFDALCWIKCHKLGTSDVTRKECEEALKEFLPLRKGTNIGTKIQA